MAMKCTVLEIRLACSRFLLDYLLLEQPKHKRTSPGNEVARYPTVGALEAP